MKKIIATALIALTMGTVVAEAQPFYYGPGGYGGAYGRGGYRSHGVGPGAWGTTYSNGCNVACGPIGPGRVGGSYYGYPGYGGGYGGGYGPGGYGGGYGYGGGAGAAIAGGVVGMAMGAIMGGAMGGGMGGPYGY